MRPQVSAELASPQIAFFVLLVNFLQKKIALFCPNSCHFEMKPQSTFDWIRYFCDYGIHLDAMQAPYFDQFFAL